MRLILDNPELDNALRIRAAYAAEMALAEAGCSLSACVVAIQHGDTSAIDAVLDAAHAAAQRVLNADLVRLIDRLASEDAESLDAAQIELPLHSAAVTRDECVALSEQITAVIEQRESDLAGVIAARRGIRAALAIVIHAYPQQVGPSPTNSKG